MSKKTKNINGLLSYSSARNQETLKKVGDAIERLKRSKTKPINFRTVAEESGVAKATLYNNAAIKERIVSLRSIQKCSESQEDRDLESSCRTTIKRLSEEVRQLQSDKKNLIAQLVKMEVLRDENERLKQVLEKFKLQN